MYAGIQRASAFGKYPSQRFPIREHNLNGPSFNWPQRPDYVRETVFFACLQTDQRKKFHSRMTVFSGDKRHVCDVTGCGKRFYREDELRRHVRTHTGERPYVCKVCGRGFQRSDHLKLHSTTHEGDNRTLPAGWGGSCARMEHLKLWHFF